MSIPIALALALSSGVPKCPRHGPSASRIGCPRGAAEVGLVTLIFLRIGALTGERVAFHGLGQDYTPLATTTIAYGGAAVLLWIISAATGHLEWIGSAFWPASVYAVSFVCYTAALALGPVGLVSGFALYPPPWLRRFRPVRRWGQRRLGLWFFERMRVLKSPCPLRSSLREPS